MGPGEVSFCLLSRYSELSIAGQVLQGLGTLIVLDEKQGGRLSGCVTMVLPGTAWPGSE